MIVRITRAIALLLLGTYTGGVVFSVLAPSVYDIPGPAYVRYWQAQNVDYGAAMPVLLLSLLAVLIVTSVLSARRGRRVLALTVITTVLVVATVVVTVTQMEPLNELANSWDPDRLPTDWESTRDDWLQWHNVRVALAVAAFGCLLASQVLDTSERVRSTASSEPSVIAG